MVFSRIALFVVCTGLLLFAIIMTFVGIVTGRENISIYNTKDEDEEISCDINKCECWTPRLWYEVDQEYHNQKQIYFDRLHHFSVSLQPLSALTLEIAMFVVGLIGTGFSTPVKGN